MYPAGSYFVSAVLLDTVQTRYLSEKQRYTFNAVHLRGFLPFPCGYVFYSSANADKKPTDPSMCVSKAVSTISPQGILLAGRIRHIVATVDGDFRTFFFAVGKMC